MGEGIADRLERALSAESPDAAVSALGADDPASVLESIRARWSAHPADREKILRLLDELGADEAILVELLDGAHGGDATDLLGRLVRRRTCVPSGALHRLFEQTRAEGDKALLHLAIEAAGLTRDPAMIGTIHPHLHDAAVRSTAALALGRLGATHHALEIAELLPCIEDSYEHGTAVVALELMGAHDVVPILLRWLADAPDSHVHELHEALHTLSGRTPVSCADPREIRALWDGWAGGPGMSGGWTPVTRAE